MSCQFCKFAVYAPGAFRATLVCNNSADHQPIWNVADANGTCANFTPVPAIHHGIVDGVGYIPLTQDKVAIVDPADYANLIRYKWWASKNTRTFYARTRVDSRDIAMHRFLMNPPKAMVVDHIDHNGLNNQRSNLRICTPNQNMRNRRPNRRKIVKYKGVTYYKDRDRYQVSIQYQRQKVAIGLFKNEIKAAKEYDKMAKKLFGEYAYLNFPEES